MTNRNDPFGKRAQAEASVDGVKLSTATSKTLVANHRAKKYPSRQPTTPAAVPSKTALPRNSEAILPERLPIARSKPISARRSRTLDHASSPTHNAQTKTIKGVTTDVTPDNSPATWSRCACSCWAIFCRFAS